MRCTIPEISWHNRDPVLSIDFQKQLPDESFCRLASGGTDSHVLIWHVKSNCDGTTSIDIASDLVRHQKAVNAVRFSPCGTFLASGDDESVIIIWKKRQDSDAPELCVSTESEVTNKESWVVVKFLRGHLEDVYDLSWSPDSSSLISGSVDNTAIVWDVAKGSRTILGDHKGFVQGVAWDPKNEFLATLSSDRKMRVFQVSSKKLVARVGKAPLPVSKTHELHDKKINLFHDDTIQTFFRRLTFSPDGELLIAPSGVIEAQETSKKVSSTTLLFSRKLLNRPVCYLPSLDQYSVCVKCCPVLFELRNIDPSTKPECMFKLPYRVIIAVATASAVVLYDTQQPMPFGYISNLHYTRLTDLAWSPQGDLLMVSSTDGYCSIITFAPGELGFVYEPREELQTPSKISEVDSEKTCIQPEANSPASSKLSLANPLIPNTQSEAKSQTPLNQSEPVCANNQDSGGIDKLISSQSDNVARQDLTKDDDDLEGIQKLADNTSEEQSEEPVPVSMVSDMSISRDDSTGSNSQMLTETLKTSNESNCSGNSLETVSESISSVATGDAKSSKPCSSSHCPPSISESPKGSNPVSSSDSTAKDVIITPGNSGKKGRRVQLVTLSSPKSKKKLL